MSAEAQQGAGTLTGKIEDAATKAPVADAVVTLTSPALQGEEVAVTDSSGTYRIPNLPPGVYTIRLEKESYRPYSRAGVGLRADVTLRVDASLLPESIKAEEIVVVARPPTIDVGSTSTGTSISSEFTSRVPVSAPLSKGGGVRSFESVAEVTPQATPDNYGVSINGTTSPENQYMVDGLSVNNTSYGVIGTPLSIEFIKETTVLTGGYMPEYGKSTGGVLSAVTKSGSNEFHGSAWMNVTPGFAEGNRKDIRRVGTSVQTNPKLQSIYDIGADVGGPIIKDKLWFYVGFSFSRTGYYLNRDVVRRRGFIPDPNAPLPAAGAPDKRKLVPTLEDGLEAIDSIPGALRQYTAQSQTLQTFGKLTYTINQNNRISLSLTAAPSWSGGDGTYPINPQSGGVPVNLAGDLAALSSRRVTGGYDGVLKWTTDANNKRLLLDTSVGWHHEVDSLRAVDGTRVGDTSGLAGVNAIQWRRNNPAPHSITDFDPSPELSAACPPAPADHPEKVTCPATQYFTGGPGFLSDRTTDRYQARSVLTYLAEGAGHHVVKAGFDSEVALYDHTKGYSGGIYYREAPNGKSFTDFRAYGFLIGPDTPVLLRSLHWRSSSVSVGGFLQDSWSVMDKITLNLGVRYDAQYIYGGQGTLGLALPNQWSPRIGVIYDPTQEGRAKVFANYARFYENVPLDLADRSASSETQIHSVHPLGASCGYGGATDVKCPNPNVRNVQGDPQSPDKKWALIGAGRVPIDPDIRPQSSHEVVLGGELDVFRDARIGVSYTRRWMANVVEDMSRDEAATYFIGNPGSRIAKDFPKAERNYDAGTVYFNKAFSGGWLTQASYTLASLRGNYAGLFRPETNQLDPNINSDFDLLSLMANRDGPLPGDNRHQLKAFGAKQFDIPGGIELVLGAGGRAKSGGPTSYWGSHPLYGPDEAFILPRGSGPRLPWTYSIDTKVAVGYRVDKDVTISLMLDVFNIANFQTETNVDQRFTISDVLPIKDGTLADLEKDNFSNVRKSNGTPLTDDEKRTFKWPNYGRPIQYQQPRTFRFGIRGTF